MIIAQLVALGFGIFGIVKLVQQETIGAAYLIVAVGVICAIELDLLYEWLHNKKKK
jgi:1,4-dihydroxy-2-naphthoate octaprenyltransferase